MESGTDFIQGLRGLLVPFKQLYVIKPLKYSENIQNTRKLHN